MLTLAFVYLIIQAIFAGVIDRVVEPKNWIEIGRSDANKEIKLIFAVKQENVDVLYKSLIEKSTPGNKEYGNWYTNDEVHELIAPSKKTLLVIKKWLISNQFNESDIIPVTRNNDFLSVITTIGKAELLLNCEYYDYIHIKKKEMKVSRVRIGTNYYVDDSVSPYLDFISPTKRFPPISTLKMRVGAGTVTPTTLRSLYNVGTAEGSSSSNSQGVASFQDQLYSKSDLEKFWKKYDIDTDTVIDVPANTSSGTGLEAELDTQYISSLGEKITMQVWYTKGFTDFDDALLTWATNVANDDDAPYLFSVSYGQTEKSAGESYVNRLNTQLASIGSRGITVFFAAGDSGAGGGCSIAEGDIFEPDYPACSPYVTAVGGVHGGTAGKTPVGETVWTDGGGGFSNYSPRQTWQETAVANYLSTDNKLPDSSRYNSSGRGFPDISAQSVDFEVMKDGVEVAVDGTSCASPTAGGIFALLNDLRLQNNMSPLGFANVLIYQLASKYTDAFNDCTDGYNKGCTGSVSEGFYAEKGWDPASGNGSPNYSALAKYVLESGQSTTIYGSRFQRRR